MSIYIEFDDVAKPAETVARLFQVNAILITGKITEPYHFPCVEYTTVMVPPIDSPAVPKDVRTGEIKLPVKYADFMNHVKKEVVGNAGIVRLYGEDYEALVRANPGPRRPGL